MLWHSLRLLSESNVGAITPLARASISVTPPEGFSFHHVLGSAQFQLCRRTRQCSTVIHCDVRKKSIMAAGLGRNGQESRRTHLRVRDLARHNPSRVSFSCLATFAPQVCSLHMEVVCHALLGHLVVDSVCFSEDRVSFVTGPEECPSQMLYRGPDMTQSHLAEFLCSHSRDSSPVFDSPQTGLSPFGQRAGFLPAPLQAFGHRPVHTVSPKLLSKVTSLLACCHVNDKLADFIQTTVPIVEEREQKAWLSLTADEFL